MSGTAASCNNQATFGYLNTYLNRKRFVPRARRRPDMAYEGSAIAATVTGTVHELTVVMRNVVDVANFDVHRS